MKKDYIREIETIHNLHGIKKIEHIIAYYWMHILFVLGLFSLIIFLIFNFHNNAVPSRLYITLFTDSSEDYTDWGAALINQMPEEKGAVEWEQNTYFTNAASNLAIDKTYLSTRIAAREYDVIISTSTLYDYMLELECVRPLNDILSDAQIETYGNSTGNIYAIELTSRQFPETEKEPYYLYICSTTRHLTDAAKMLQLILQN